MATWKFVIRGKKGVCPIYIRYTHRSGWKNIPTKQKAPSDYWDAENGKLNRFCPQGQRKELTGRLKIWEDAITTVIANNIRDGLSLAPADVKAAVIGLVKSNSHSRPSMTVDAAFQQYLAEKTEIRSSTKQVYNAMKNHLDTYCQEKKVPLDWALFDRRFERGWKEYFLAHKKQDNTVGKYFKTLKTFLYWCSENHYFGSRDYEKYKVYANEIEIYPLTVDELKSIEKFAKDKANNEQDRTIARIFLFLCNTGLRISDFHKLTYKNISVQKMPSDKFRKGYDYTFALRIDTQKTGDRLSIPLNDDARHQIIKLNPDFENGFATWGMDESDPDLYVTNDHMTQMIAESPDKPIFPYIPDYLINRRIKEIGKKCNIDTAELQRKEYGGNVDSVYTEKYKTLSCHTARRTFITIAINNDMNPLVIMEITGHKAYKTMKRYMKVTEDTKRREMEKWGKTSGLPQTAPSTSSPPKMKDQPAQSTRYKKADK